MVLYDAPDCWKCVEVKEPSAAQGIPFEAVTVRGDPVARAALVAARASRPRSRCSWTGTWPWDRRRILAYLDLRGGPVRGRALLSRHAIVRRGHLRVNGGGAC